MSDALSEASRLERLWAEIDREHGGVCPHEDVDPVFGTCRLCGWPVPEPSHDQEKEP